MLEAELERILRQAVDGGATPSAVCAVAVDGHQLSTVVVGDAVRFGSDGKELPQTRRLAASEDTLYDLASITKVFTAVTALTLVDEGTLALDVPLATWLPQYQVAGKESATLRHLLTHTAGLSPIWSGWQAPLAAGRPFDRTELLADLLAMPLLRPTGTAFEYSCVGFNTIMALAEAATGQPWAKLVAARVLAKLPAGLTFTPDEARCAATEFDPDHGRGMIRGTVHDESSWSLGGGTGNAGMFGTAASLLAFGELLRAGFPGVLSPEAAGQMWHDQLPEVLGTHAESGGPGYGHGLGLRIGEGAWMGRHGGAARGHTGFTGPSLMVDREAGLTVVLLTNRVHPSRELSDVQPLRRAVADAVYASVRQERHAN